jgi:ClpP class serine protease
MHNRVLAAIRGMPWAILPEYLAAIEALAERVLDHPALIKVEADGHAERFDAMLASMGERVPGTARATVRDGVGVLPIMGPIFPRANIMTNMSGATALSQAAQDLAGLQASGNVRQILLAIDSPGGAVDMVHQFARLVANSPKPVSAHVDGTCASAAYWIASAAPGGISIDPISRVGSIGVVMSTSYQETPDSSGRRAVDIVSSGAPNKRPDLSTEEGRAEIVKTLDAIESVFIADVAKGRGVSADDVRADFGQGGTKTGQQAKDAGMVDAVEPSGLDGAIRRLSARMPGTSRRTAAAHLELAHLRARNH